MERTAREVGGQVAWGEQRTELECQETSLEGLEAAWTVGMHKAEKRCKLSAADLRERILIMLNSECDFMPSHDYIETTQGNVMRTQWRTKVVSWLLEFEEEYGISQDTISVAVNYMDRYLSQVRTKKSIMQLLAMGAVLVAAKLHETYPIGMNELRDLADGTYLVSDIKLMELELLRVIQWRLNPITPQMVMNHLLQYIPCDKDRAVVHEDAVTFLDVAIPEYAFLRFRPSVQAVAAILCAFETTQVYSEQWALALNEYGILDAPEVLQCQALMLQIFNSLCPRSDSPVARCSVVSPVGVEELAEHERAMVAVVRAKEEEEEERGAWDAGVRLDPPTWAESRPPKRNIHQSMDGDDEVDARRANACESSPVLLNDSTLSSASSSQPVQLFPSHASVNCNVKPVAVYPRRGDGGC